MFAPRYFAHHFYPRRYYPGGIATPALPAITVCATGRGLDVDALGRTLGYAAVARGLTVVAEAR